MDSSLAAFRDGRSGQLRKLAEEHLQHEYDYDLGCNTASGTDDEQSEPIRPRHHQESGQQSIESRQGGLSFGHRTRRVYRIQAAVDASGVLQRFQGHGEARRSQVRGRPNAYGSTAQPASTRMLTILQNLFPISQTSFHRRNGVTPLLTSSSRSGVSSWVVNWVSSAALHLRRGPSPRIPRRESG